MTTRCTHCGLEIEGRPVTDESDDGPVFCCAGCRAVYHTLHQSGLDEFYRHRDSWSGGRARPVDEEVLEENDAALFDSDAFLEEHAEQVSDGTLRVQLHLEGVHCGGCVWLVERMPRRLEGVAEARLEVSRGRMTLRFDPDRIQLSDIARWLGQFGFRARPLRSGAIDRRSRASKTMLSRVGICWAVAANVMLLTIAKYAGLDPGSEAGLYHAVLWSTFGLSIVSLVAGGTVFFRRAAGSLRGGRLSMDVPISLGILVGWGHSAFATITGSGEVWFDSIVILIAALLTARYLQIRGNNLAADAAERLVSLVPRTARRFVDGGDELETVPSEALEVGDRVRVLAGDAVPADGRVVSGSSEVSRAVLTGESDPVEVGRGDAIEAGVTNLSNPLEVRITATGDQTRIGRLMDWVESGRTDRAPIVQLADRLASVFIAVVLVAATATAVAWALIEPSRAVANVVALLVIACPCALGMATPLALTVGAGQAARRGIHVKDDASIEAVDDMTDVVFDKTGTLTVGRPEVVEIFGDVDALTLGCVLEHHSNHPIAEALLRWIRTRRGPDAADPDHSEVRDVEETPGAGVTGVVDGRTVAVGRLSWFDDVPAELRRWARRRADDGLTPVAVAVDGAVRTIVAVGDRLRPDAARILDDLRDRDIRIHLLSGDHPEVVEATGRELAIAPGRINGGATPEQKLDYVERLRETREEATVAMVGDGVNDAAALDAAHVGIAVHGGTEASLVAADVFMVDEGVQPVAELFEGTDRVMNVVRRNLAGSGLYNLFGISLAAMGYITPLAAAILMPISSLAVVTSSLIQESFPDDSDRTDPTGAPHDDTIGPSRWPRPEDSTQEVA